MSKSKRTIFTSVIFLSYRNDYENSTIKDDSFSNYHSNTKNKSNKNIDHRQKSIANNEMIANLDNRTAVLNTLQEILHKNVNFLN